MFRRFTKSRTTTRPDLTFVSVPLHVSVIDHFVPRTVAELLRPRVRKRPRALPNSLRPRLRAAPPLGIRPALGHLPRLPPFIVSVVSGFFCPWVILKTPLLKLPT